MWGVVKKAINSDLNVPLNEMFRNLISASFGEINEKLGKILSKGDVIETISMRLDNLGGKQPFYEISGKSGILKIISQKNLNERDKQDFSVYIDGKFVDVKTIFGIIQNPRDYTENHLYVYNLNLEFENSVKINVAYNMSINFLIQIKK